MSNLLNEYKSVAKKNIQEAQCLPFEAYTNALVFNEEKNNIFYNDWVFACSAHKLTNPGEYFAFTLVDEPILIIRTKQNRLVALSNTCRHKGTQLVDNGYGKIGKYIVCPYHAWSYKDNGNLKAAPICGKIKINKEEHKLLEFHIDTILGLVFIHLGKPKITLQQKFLGLDKYCDIFDLSRFNKAYHTEQSEVWNCNWKISLENGMESYHLFKVHKNTLEIETPTRETFYVAGCPDWTITAGKILSKKSSLIKWFSSSYPEAFDHYLLISLPPSFIGILTYDSFDWIQILPDGPNKCIVNSAGVSTKVKREDKLTKEFVEAFLLEDKIICERVHKGMLSQKSKGGKLVEVEMIISDFHQYLASKLSQISYGSFKESDKANIFTQK